jgi:lysozyme
MFYIAEALPPIGIEAKPVIISSGRNRNRNRNMDGILPEVITLVKNAEGFRTHAYWDIDAYAVGYGSKKGVTSNTVVSKAEAERWLIRDMLEARDQVKRELPNVILNNNQLSALTSLVYNAGISPLLRGTTIRRALDKGDYMAAANGFRLWVKGDNGVLPGLVTRREAERAIFLKVNDRVVTLIATKDTYLKLKSSNSVMELLPSEYVFIKKGEKITCILKDTLVNSHYEIESDGVKKFVFKGHFSIH